MIGSADEADLRKILGVLANDVINVGFHHQGKQAVAAGVHVAAQVKHPFKLLVQFRGVRADITPESTLRSHLLAPK